MKLFSSLVFIAWLLPSAVFSQSPVTLAIDTRSHGWAVPADFAGLGFETWAESPDRRGISGRLFSPPNPELIFLYTNSGIRNLRLVGCTVDGVSATVPSPEDIDNLFGFARAADVKVIYSLRLLDGNVLDDASSAKYIWKHYRPYLDCFAIGNEPNEPPYSSSAESGAIKDYESYLSAWKKFAAAVTNAVPIAKFSGPDSGGTDWVARFAKDENNSGMLVLFTQHEYVGGKPYLKGSHESIPASEAINNMLSPKWVTNNYVSFYKKTWGTTATCNLPCRLTEADDYLHGVPNASDTFASALWALDYMHWWASHGGAGVNFHNNQQHEWLKTDTIYFDGSSKEYRINPKAYAIKAFDLGSHGSVEPVAINNTNGLNLTAYAIGDLTNVCITIINKEHGQDARDAAVTILPQNLPLKNAAVM